MTFSQVFLRPGVLDELQRLRLEHINAYAALVQRFVRGALCRIMLKKMKEVSLTPPPC